MSIISRLTEAVTKAFSGTAQQNMDEGWQDPTTQTRLESTTRAYELVEIVNRCINILVDNGALLEFDIKNTLSYTGQSGKQVKASTLDRLLNFRPNIEQDISSFKRQLLMDFLIDGNAFVYFDGASMYRMPAHEVVIHHKGSQYISHFEYGGKNYTKKEVIHISDNSIRTSRRGYSRILSAMDTLYSREEMIDFKKAFFKNGTSIGLIVESDDFLNAKLKKRTQEQWAREYHPTNGANKPLILDGGMKAKTIASTDFRSMAFNETVTQDEEKVAMALGVPPILLNSGNNANLKPNLELLFYLTIIPMLRKFISAFEYFFAFDIDLRTHKVPALKPDLKAEAERVSSLVNNGIITGNEGRAMIRLDELDDPQMQVIRIPANIAGSGTGVTGQEGGRPSSESGDN